MIPLVIENSGPAIRYTNYWGSAHAKSGLFYLSWNAGAARVLVPHKNRAMLKEMASAHSVIVSRGPWIEQGGMDALELLWEDGSDAPFVLILPVQQCDRILPDTEHGAGFVVSAWTREGQQGTWPGLYQRVDSLPCMQAWGSK